MCVYWLNLVIVKRGNRKYEVFEVGVCLVCLKYSMEVIVGYVVGGEVGEGGKG